MRSIQEIFAIIISIILAIVIGFLVNWSFSELLSIQSVISYFLMSGIIAVLIYGFKPRVEKFFKKYEKHLDEHSEESILIKTPTYDENAHLQNLNTVYQKLFQMRLLETSRNVWSMKALVELNGDQLMHAMNIPDLDRSLIHLGQNDRYKNLVDLWTDLGSCVSTYNKNIPSFVEFLENHIRKIMSEKTKHVEKKNDEEGYSVNPMRQSLMYLLTLQSEDIPLLHSFHLRISKVYNHIIWFETHHLLVDGGLFTVVDGNPEEIRDEIGKLLLEIAMDKTVLNKYKPHYDLLQKMKSAEKEFKSNLEPLIHDIENNGFTVKGKCDLGY